MMTIFTEKEKNVLRLWLDDKTAPEIAEVLGIAENTVRSYKTRIMNKVLRFGIEDIDELRRKMTETNFRNKIGFLPEPDEENALIKNPTKK